MYQLVGPNVPQLQLSLVASQENFVQVRTGMHCTCHLEGVEVKVQLTINFCVCIALCKQISKLRLPLADRVMGSCQEPTNLSASHAISSSSSCCQWRPNIPQMVAESVPHPRGHDTHPPPSPS